MINSTDKETIETKHHVQSIRIYLYRIRQNQNKQNGRRIGLHQYKCANALSVFVVFITCQNAYSLSAAQPCIRRFQHVVLGCAAKRISKRCALCRLTRKLLLVHSDAANVFLVSFGLVRDTKLRFGFVSVSFTAQWSTIYCNLYIIEQRSVSNDQEFFHIWIRQSHTKYGSTSLYEPLCTFWACIFANNCIINALIYGKKPLLNFPINQHFDFGMPWKVQIFFSIWILRKYFNCKIFTNPILYLKFKFWTFIPFFNQPIFHCSTKTIKMAICHTLSFIEKNKSDFLFTISSFLFKFFFRTVFCDFSNEKTYKKSIFSTEFQLPKIISIKYSTYSPHCNDGIVKSCLWVRERQIKTNETQYVRWPSNRLYGYNICVNRIWRRKPKHTHMLGCAAKSMVALNVCYLIYSHTRRDYESSEANERR